MTNFTKILFLSLSHYFFIPMGTAEELTEINFNGNKNMKICDLPENINNFTQAIESMVGSEITEKDMELLQHEFGILKDKVTYDYFFSRTEKVRFTLLEKDCTADDSVPYKFLVGGEVDGSGAAIFHQFFLVYDKQVFLQNKRKFKFEHKLGGDEDYTEIISKQTVGFNSEQLDEYMESLDCTELESLNGANSKRYSYKIEPQTHFLSRMYSWDLSLEISAKFDSSGIINAITVINRTTNK